MRVNVYIDRQRLDLRDDAGRVVETYPVSTAKNGPGERYGSECTPRGLHSVRAKIGAGCPGNTVFVRRRPTGEIWTPELARKTPQRDWMLTRILWLSGRERGFNRGGAVDSLRRKIYIHGTGDEATLGVPASHGCIRMSNAGIVELFDRLTAGADVGIGRLAVERARRGRGVGSAILARLVDLARSAGLERVILNARTDAEGFYARHGFAAAGAEFTEAGIRHRRMERVLAAASTAE